MQFTLLDTLYPKRKRRKGVSLSRCHLCTSLVLKPISVNAAFASPPFARHCPCQPSPCGTHRKVQPGACDARGKATLGASSAGWCFLHAHSLFTTDMEIIVRASYCVVGFLTPCRAILIASGWWSVWEPNSAFKCMLTSLAQRWVYPHSACVIADWNAVSKCIRRLLSDKGWSKGLCFKGL